MRHENVGVVHTHTCISLIEEKRVEEIYSKSAVLKYRYELKRAVATRAFIINLIFNISRLLFSKQNDLLLKDNFILFKEIKIKINGFLKKVKMQNNVFEEIIISRSSKVVC